VLTELEQKLLTLALDPAAQPGEWASAATKLVKSLRDRKLNGYDPGLKQKMGVGSKAPPVDEIEKWPGSIIVDFGKHKGRKLAEIDPGYLRWYTENCDDGTGRNADMLQAMRWLLDDLKNRRRSR
jgi:uncharacterized protein (DUF3820 family)